MPNRRNTGRARRAVASRSPQIPRIPARSQVSTPPPDTHALHPGMFVLLKPSCTCASGVPAGPTPLSCATCEWVPRGPAPSPVLCDVSLCPCRPYGHLGLSTCTRGPSPSLQGSETCGTTWNLVTAGVLCLSLSRDLVPMIGCPYSLPACSRLPCPSTGSDSPGGSSPPRRQWWRPWLDHATGTRP